MTEFFKTLMGRKFYEADVPRLVGALERIADALEGSKRPPMVAEPRVKVAVYSNDPRSYADLVSAPDGVIVSYEYHERGADYTYTSDECANCDGSGCCDCKCECVQERGKPVTQLSEDKCGAKICCEDPECVNNGVRAEKLAREFQRIEAAGENGDYGVNEDHTSDDLIDVARALSAAVLANASKENKP